MPKKECKKKCNVEHFYEGAETKCTECGACLHCHSVQIPDPEFPFFRCTACNKVNFWD